MTTDYQLTRTAEDELEEILLHVSEVDGIRRALHVHGRFERAFEHLASMPASGSRQPGLSGERFRRWIVFRWIVIYDPKTIPITILRVIHGGRELGRVLRHEL